VKLAAVMNQIYLTDMYRIFHPKARKYAFFSALHSAISKTEHINSHNTDLTDT
jgi:exonuclease III